MAQKVTFSAEPRKILGKKVKQLRNSGQIPANVSGDIDSPMAVTFDRMKFQKLYKKVGDTGLFYLTVAGEKVERPVLVTEVQIDPIKSTLEHVSLRQVDLSEKVTAEVPVEVIGELQVRNALIVTVRDTVLVEALPQDLPEKFEIDISVLKGFGEMVTFAQLSYDKSKVTLKIEPEQEKEPIVMVQEIKEEVEAAPVVAPTAEATPAATTDAAAAAKPAEAKAEKK